MTRRQLYLLAGIMTVFQPTLFQDKVAPTANAMDELRVEGASQQPDASNEFDRAIVLADLAHQAEREGLLHLALRYRSERVRVLQEQYSDDHWHVIKARNEKKDGAALVRLWEDQDTRMRVMELVRLEGDVLRLGAQQRMPEVLPKALRLLDLTDELLGNVSHRYLINAKRVALVYRYIDRLDKAIPRWRDSLAIAEQLYGNAHPMYAITLSGWADTLVKSGDFDDAIDKFVSALDILRQESPGSVYHVDIMIRLARGHRHNNDLDRASQILDQAEGLLGNQLNEELAIHKLVQSRVYMERGELVASMKGAMASLPHFEQAIQLLQEIGVTESTNYLRALARFGRRGALSDDPQQRAMGLERMQEVLDEFERRYGVEGVFYVQILGRRAQVHAYWQEWDQAAELFAHTLKVLKKHDLGDSSYFREIQCDYENVLRQKAERDN